jgi:hypothetical protein
VSFGERVPNVPADLLALYEEARRCTSHDAYTAAVLVLRKLLMNIAVANGADTGKRFVEYVEHLAANHFVPPNGKPWVDHIRKRGNEANHEIQLMTEQDAKDLVVFSQMLLTFIYDFPSRIPSAAP